MCVGVGCSSATNLFLKMNNSSVPSNTTFPQQADKRVVTWCVTYAIVAITVILNNGAAIAAFRHSRLLRKFGNYFLVNLAVADLMVGTIALPMYIHLIYNYNKPSLQPVQTMHTAVDVFSGMASAFTLTAISLERVYAIYYPLRHCSTSKTAYFVILGAVWLLAGALSGTWILTFFKIIHPGIFAFSLGLLSITSLMLMLAAYIGLWLKIKLWSKHQQGISGERERSLAVAIGIVTVVFLLTWTPFHIMNVLINYKSSLFDGFPYLVVYFAKLLHYSNSFVNPIIYCFKIYEFRRALKNLLTRRKKRRETKV